MRGDWWDLQQVQAALHVSLVAWFLISELQKSILDVKNLLLLFSAPSFWVRYKLPKEIQPAQWFRHSENKSTHEIKMTDESDKGRYTQKTSLEKQGRLDKAKWWFCYKARSCQNLLMIYSILCGCPALSWPPKYNIRKGSRADRAALSSHLNGDTPWIITHNFATHCNPQWFLLYCRWW